MSDFNLNYWLRKLPRPVAVMVDAQRVEVPRNGRAWKELEQTVKSLEPSKLTCLNGQGQVIRSIVLDDVDDERPAAAPVSQDMTDLQFFGKLLAEGYKDGRAANQPIIDSAMQWVEQQSQRLLRADAENDRLRAQIHKLNQKIVELSNQPTVDVASEGETLVGALMAGMAQGAAAAGQSQSVVSPITKGAKK